MKVSVDKSKCIGCGSCEAICPRVFRLGEDGLSEVLLNPVPPEEESSAQEAADNCPVEAILIE